MTKTDRVICINRFNPISKNIKVNLEGRNGERAAQMAGGQDCIDGKMGKSGERQVIEKIPVRKYVMGRESK